MEITNNITSPLFSIIVANYNNGRFLDECIESIKQQTYNNWEIILVDDASTDNSKKIYNTYKNDDRIKIFYNHSNKGVGYTKRKAVENSNGKYCGVVDPDDIITPDALKLVVNKFEQNPSAAIVHTNHYICDENLSVIKISTNNGIIPVGESQLSFNGPKVGHFWAFRKKMYDLTGGINPKLKRAEDQDILYKLEEIGSIIYIDIPTYFYRYHTNGLSTNSSFMKAIYWNLQVSEDARKRREWSKSKTPNITRYELSKRWLNYYQSFAIEKYKKKEIKKALYLILKSCKYIWYDKNLLSIRILVRYIIFKKPLKK